jgi:ABC-2 type transport system permease protein
VYVSVLVSRSIYSGFIAVLLFIILRRVVLFVLSGPDNQTLIALFDPFAQASVYMSVQYWTTDQINTLNIPFSNLIIYNRLIWLTLPTIISFWAYKKFTFTQCVPPVNIFRKVVTTKNVISTSTEVKNKTALKINISFSFYDKVRSVWRMSVFEFRSIFLSRSFLAIIIGSIVFMYLILAQANPQYTTRIYPLTQVMLMVPSLFFSFIIGLITFLYAGILIHKDRTANIHQLVDVTPTPNWVLMGSKFIALIKIQAVLLSVVLIVGILVQTIRGYYNYEIGLYLFDLYALSFVSLIIWAMLAFFVHSVLPNQYVGFFLLILFSIGIGGLDSIGIKLDILKFNSAPILEYSDLNGYGNQLRSYFFHKLYWLFFGGLLLIGGLLFWVRGYTQNFRERVLISLVRPTKMVIRIASTLFMFFLITGSVIYDYAYTSEPSISEKQKTLHKIELERKFGHLKNSVQPRLSRVNIHMNLYPEERNYTSTGILTFVNKSDQPIDTLTLNFPVNANSEYLLSSNAEVLLSDSVLNIDILKFKEPLLPNDSLFLEFSTNSIPSTYFLSNSEVIENGTFMLADLFSVGLNEENKEVLPSDPKASQNSYVGNNIDPFDFEAVVSTSGDQVALAPGELQERWTDGNRTYFHYKSNEKIRNGIVFNSGRFKVKRERFNGIDLEIYHHTTHTFNLDRMMDAMKATLEFAEEHYTPYQFKQMRIIEFPKTYGDFAQSFANTIPYSEFAGFISKEDTSDNNRVDQVFRLVAHEMAHQWWGHQVVPSNALGSRIITEGLAEYTSIKVLEKEYGEEAGQLYLKFLSNRLKRTEAKTNNTSTPLVLAEPDQAHLNYHKAALTYLYLENEIGETAFKNALKTFIQTYSMKSVPYPTSMNLVDEIKNATSVLNNHMIYTLFESDTTNSNQILIEESVE